MNVLLTRLISVGAVATLLLGCDIVQGFQSAGDTLFPEEATHLNAPGVRLVSGGYRELRFATGGELFLLARSPEDERALYSMRYSDPRPCKIPNVGRYTASQQAVRPMIAYLEDNSRVGTLRFADATCNPYDMELPDANMPVMETSRGFVIRSGTQLLMVDPSTRQKDVIADPADQVFRDAFAGRHLVRRGGSIEVFDREWESQGTFGKSVGGFNRLRQSFVFEDAGRIARLAPVAAEGGGVQENTIAEDACVLGIRSDTWATYWSPCADKRLQVYSEATQRAVTLNFQADPFFIRLQPALGSPGQDPSKDPFWFFHLRDVVADNLGTLLVRTPDGRDLEIGALASLGNVRVVESGGTPYGYALVDIEAGVGTLVWWSATGEVKELARGVLRDGRRLIIDYDGTVGNLAVVSGQRVFVVARGVPANTFEYPDREGRWTALFHDFDGSGGKLSVIAHTLDDLEAVPPDAPFPSVTLDNFAESIPHNGAALLNYLMPGVTYYSDYDTERRTGTLVYRNLELRYTGLVNYGISDFIVAEDEIVYSIPFGSSAGVWLVQGK